MIRTIKIEGRYGDRNPKSEMLEALMNEIEVSVIGTMLANTPFTELKHNIGDSYDGSSNVSITFERDGSKSIKGT